jgi:Ca2+/H+ antiporter
MLIFASIVKLLVDAYVMMYRHDFLDCWRKQFLYLFAWCTVKVYLITLPACLGTAEISFVSTFSDIYTRVHHHELVRFAEKP